MSKTENGADSGRKHYLFSYGTLLPRLAPAEIRPTVQRLRRVGKGFVRGQLFDLGECPGAVLGRSGSPIAGQVFELPDDPEVCIGWTSTRDLIRPIPGRAFLSASGATFN